MPSERPLGELAHLPDHALANGLVANHAAAPIIMLISSFAAKYFSVIVIECPRNVITFLPPLIFDLAAIALSTALGWALQRLGAALWRPVDRALAGTDWLR